MDEHKPIKMSTDFLSQLKKTPTEMNAPRAKSYENMMKNHKGNVYEEKSC